MIHCYLTALENVYELFKSAFHVFNYLQAVLFITRSSKVLIL